MAIPQGVPNADNLVRQIQVVWKLLPESLLLPGDCLPAQPRCGDITHIGLRAAEIKVANDPGLDEVDVGGSGTSLSVIPANGVPQRQSSLGCSALPEFYQA